MEYTVNRFRTAGEDTWCDLTWLLPNGKLLEDSIIVDPEWTPADLARVLGRRVTRVIVPQHVKAAGIESSSLLDLVGLKAQTPEVVEN